MLRDLLAIKKHSETDGGMVGRGGEGAQGMRGWKSLETKFGHSVKVFAKTLTDQRGFEIVIDDR